MKISSADFGREPDRYQGLASAEPVVVTRDGRDSAVVISAKEFRRLERRDRAVLGIEDFTPAEVEAVRAAKPSRQAEAYDDEMDAGG